MEILSLCRTVKKYRENKIMIQIKIENRTPFKKIYSPVKLKKIAEKILKGEGFHEKDYEISLVFCDDELIRNLNKTYRKRDTSTDVLSFSVPPEFPIGEIQHLGEIVISLETVFGRYPNNLEKIKQEVYLLYCHALLHLLGYIHDTPKQRRNMMEKQSKYLNIDLESAWIKYSKGIEKRR